MSRELYSTDSGVFGMTKKILFMIGVASVTLIPNTAFAKENCERNRSGRVIGTVAGAGVGAVAGGVIAKRGDSEVGAVIGGLAGAIIGNQVSKSKQDCSRAYGYYDKNGYWHATGVDRASATGYYDRDGEWRDGSPNGYYSNDGRWVSANNNDSTSAGYYDRNGHWVPSSANGYYDRNDQWIAGSAPGYYDSRGRWVEGAVTGRYDRNGRWMQGAPSGRRDANGNWIAEPQLGYYDSNGRWRAGTAAGYYDSRGRWIATSNGNYDQSSNAYGRMPTDVTERRRWLSDYVRTAQDQRRLNRNESLYAMRELDSIGRREQMFRRSNGRFTANEEATIRVRLDRLSNRLEIASN